MNFELLGFVPELLRRNKDRTARWITHNEYVEDYYFHWDDSDEFNKNLVSGFTQIKNITIDLRRNPWSTKIFSQWLPAFPRLNLLISDHKKLYSKLQWLKSSERLVLELKNIPIRNRLKVLAQISTQLSNVELKITHVMTKRDDLYDILILLELTNKTKFLTLSCVTFQSSSEVKRFGTALRNQPLNDLDVSFSNTEDTLIEQFVAECRKIETLKSFFLNSGAGHRRALALPQISKLSLSKYEDMIPKKNCDNIQLISINSCDSLNIPCLSRCLSYLPNLWHLHLSSRIPIDITNLIPTLQTLPIRNLYLDFIFARKSLLSNFLSSLDKFRNLVQFSIMKSNYIEDEVIQKFGENLVSLSSLREISMHECKFSKAAIESLSSYLVRWVALEKLNIPGLSKNVYIQLVNLIDYFTKIK